MNKTLERLMKIMPFLGVLFILFGLIMVIFSVFNHNVKSLTSSLFLIAQAVLLIIWTKMFRKIWEK